MENIKTITSNELKNKMDKKENFVLIDILGEFSYGRAHVPGAVMIDAHQSDFVVQIKKMFPNMNQEIIVYCASFSCPLSGESANRLVNAGYQKVLAFEGGLMDWAKAGYDFEGNQASEMKKAWSK
jgi:rhodanese-related sulfurtransferase